ncbi:MAG: quinone-dependent dihydroorotate dehydrogenase [Thermoflavifilum sp.]|uniref:quinone-dependent dihydroorotate dehydrogenase n=1 Tax=Thermoflavifilum sp. TaxID=1968839 RepID=UPI0018A48A3E|nr:quinone-dependent dihydroorotate dehydrogenase [Thermoflavifilum sp.]QOR74931.1 MAG: quinone-dependent dihydroorotate dehydrogenase [Thermoflavifilum sp.]
MYASLRKLLFLFPPERAHKLAMRGLKQIHQFRIGKQWLQRHFCVVHPVLQRQVMGLSFPNPVGLAAGFDKNAQYVELLAALGFGFIEIGTVTHRPQAGNRRPRLFRLPADEALINRMGFNNDGVFAIAARLRAIRSRDKQLIIGGNIGKNKETPNEQALIDYGICFEALYDTVDYFVINVSSPNTPGLRDLQQRDALREIVQHLQTLNQAKPLARPLLVKIAPDLDLPEVDQILEVAQQFRLAGIIASNTSVRRDGLHTPARVLQRIGDGGLSGRPLFPRTLHMISYISRQTSGSLPIIASGGIFTADDARAVMDAGASLVQIYTGMIYQGPTLIRQICEALLPAHPSGA